MNKTFDFATLEPQIRIKWENASANRPKRPDAEPFCIVIPPPNVTGHLHMGHALNTTLQDILARYWRMKGKDVLWQPGTDHAGIATQMVVERQLAEQGLDRRTLGREEFLKRVWAWKEQSGGAIVEQLKRLGASCDWSRERFTLDDGLSRAVRKIFVQLYDKGLIYRDKRLVNWDPVLETAISDVELVQVECRGTFTWSRESGDFFDEQTLGKALAKNPNGHLYYFEYPFKDGQDSIIVATTRPETMLGDVAVAVHPEDERYKAYIGRSLCLPLIDLPIPIIADEYVDPEKGTGAVKITPAHDFNDEKVGKRHDHLKPRNIFDNKARLSLDVYQSRNLYGNFSLLKHLPNEKREEVMRIIDSLNHLDRFEARVKIVALMAERGRLVKIEPHTHMVPYGDRSHAVIEPWPTEQWYVNAKALAQPALAAVREGKMQFVPKTWEKTYFQWLDNIQPWCISRQLWWGHQIPVWYGPLMEPEKDQSFQDFVVETEDEAREKASAYYKVSPEDIEIHTDPSIFQENSWRFQATIDHIENNGSLEGIELLRVPLFRDPDVLDTWFSSALWPFSTLGWPDKTPELSRFYPTNVLVTGFDIIFFWVARMMMMGLHFQNNVPFKQVYIHALVRDEAGAKMSKSKGNVVDPLTLMDTYGTDALRFTLAAMAAQGRDIKLSIPRIEGYRNFATKLWNAARFAEVNGCKRDPGFDPAQAHTILNRWILGEAGGALTEVAEHIEHYRFNDAANAAYRFVWSVFCDWCLELAKPILQGQASEEVRAETRATIAYVLDLACAMLHPFMPYITEELWAIQGHSQLLTLADWPQAPDKDLAAKAEIGFVIDLIEAVRSIRAEMGIAPAVPLRLVVIDPSSRIEDYLARWRGTLERIGKIGTIDTASLSPRGSVMIVLQDVQVALPLEGVVDFEVERARLAKEIAREKGEINKLAQKLHTPDFLARAPEEIIEDHRERHEVGLTRVSKWEMALARLEGL